MCDGTGAEPHVSEEVIWENGWYRGGAVAAALSTVTSGERSTWDSIFTYVPPVSLMAQALTYLTF